MSFSWEQRRLNRFCVLDCTCQAMAFCPSKCAFPLRPPPSSLETNNRCQGRSRQAPPWSDLAVRSRSALQRLQPSWQRYLPTAAQPAAASSEKEQHLPPATRKLPLGVRTPRPQRHRRIAAADPEISSIVHTKHDHRHVQRGRRRRHGPQRADTGGQAILALRHGGLRLRDALRAACGG